MANVDKNLYFNNLTGEYEEGYRDPDTHIVYFGSEPVERTDAAVEKAQELGVDISSVTGTGKDGKVTAQDVEKAAK